MIDPRCQGTRDSSHSWRTTARSPRRRHRCTRLVDLKWFVPAEGTHGLLSGAIRRKANCKFHAWLSHKSNETYRSLSRASVSGGPPASGSPIYIQSKTRNRIERKRARVCVCVCETEREREKERERERERLEPRASALPSSVRVNWLVVTSRHEFQLLRASISMLRYTRYALRATNEKRVRRFRNFQSPAAAI